MPEETTGASAIETAQKRGNPNELIYFQEQAPTEAPPKKIKWAPAGNMATAFEHEEQITAQARRLVLWLMAEVNGHLETDLAEAVCNRAMEILSRKRRLDDAERQLLIR